MAKGKPITTQGRELRIKSCEECKGNPPQEPYTAQHFNGMKCSICWEILTVLENGIEIKIKGADKKSRVQRQPKVKSKIELPAKFILTNQSIEQEFILL